MRRTSWLLGAVLAAGCSASVYGGVGPGETDNFDGPSGDGDPDGDFFDLSVDTSATDPFIQDFPATTTVRGVASASLGLETVEVGGTVVPTDGGGGFEAEVPVTPGLTLVPVVATDSAGNTRNGHRALLAARFLPEGEINPGAAAITVTNEILQALAGDQLSDVANLDLSQQIMDEAGSISQQGCDITLDSVRHGSPSLTLTVEGGQLVVNFTIPDLYVTFHGECSMILSTTSFYGDLVTDVVVNTTLSAAASQTCLETFDHTYPTVTLPGFDLSLNSNDGGLIGMMIPLVGEIMQDSFSQQMSEQIAVQADDLIAEQVAQFGQMGMGEDVQMEFNGVNMSIGFCLTALESVDGELRARIGLSVMGPGGYPAPGAPMVDGELGGAVPGTLWMDSNLIAQMMFSLWSGGGLSGESTGDINTGLLGLLVPEIAEMYPGDTPVTVSIDGLLPPIVHAADPATGGDLLVDIGDLIIQLEVEGQLLFEMSALVHLTLDLQSQDGAITPVIVDSSAEVTVLDEPIADVDDGLLQAAVASQIGGQADRLLGEAGFALPAFGGLTLVPQEATAEPGGRYVRITLAQ